jgi:hypothetical protein
VIVRDDEYLDFSKVPESKGVPAGIYRLVAVALVIIFAIGAAVCLMSGYGHHWPAITTERVDLSHPDQ